MEPLSVLAAVAAVTTRIKLTTGVLVSPFDRRCCSPRRPPPSTISPVVVWSSASASVGNPRSSPQCGVDFAQRGQLLTDGVAACRALWGEDPASFRSSTTNFDDLWCNPKPVRADGIPVLFSGSMGRRNLARIVELGNGWITHPRQPLDETAAAVDSLVRRYREHGRDPESLIVRTSLGIVRPDPQKDPDFEASFASADATATPASPMSRSGRTASSTPVNMRRSASPRSAHWRHVRTGRGACEPPRWTHRRSSPVPRKESDEESRSHSRSEGASIAVVDRNRDGAVDATNECRGRGVRAEPFTCDVADRADVTRTIDSVVDTFGGLQILVNNAHAFTLGIPLIDTTDDDMEQSWRTAVLGTLYFMQAAYDALTVDGGKILNIGSGSALDGDAGSASYASAKEGVRVLTRVAAREWGPHGIHVNTLCPFARSPPGRRSRRNTPDGSSAKRRRCRCAAPPVMPSSTSAEPRCFW